MVTKIEAIRIWSQKIREGVMPGINLRTGRCRYRGATECAIGVLIPHDKMPENCQYGISTWQMADHCRSSGVDLNDIIDGFDAADLGVVQDTHDESARYFPKNFRQEFFRRLRASAQFRDVPEEIWQEVLQ